MDLAYSFHGGWIRHTERPTSTHKVRTHILALPTLANLTGNFIFLDLEHGTDSNCTLACYLLCLSLLLSMQVSLVCWNGLRARTKDASWMLGETTCQLCAPIFLHRSEGSWPLATVTVDKYYLFSRDARHV